jgi:ParB family chromosome partitioning protein
MTPTAPAGLRIDPAFRDLIPPMHPDELRLLEQSLQSEGCRDPLTLWAEECTLLDGHNRHEICTRFGIPFQTKPISFSSRAAAELWVIENQLGRRNLADIDRIALAAKREPLIRARAATSQGWRTHVPQNSAEGDGPIETRKEAAASAGVSHDTYAKGKRILERGVPELVQAIRDGRASIHAASALADLPADKQRAALHDDNIIEAARQARAHIARATGDPEWYTPQEYITAARDVLGGIDLDPASNPVAQERVQAALYYTVEQDGLAQAWSGRVWLNPPYAHPLVEQFTDKLVTEYRAGAITAAIMLVNNATDTIWWQKASEASSAICFPQGRIRFERACGKPGSPLQGQSVLYFGGGVDRFSSTFETFGRVLHQARRHHDVG